MDWDWNTYLTYLRHAEDTHVDCRCVDPADKVLRYVNAYKHNYIDEVNKNKKTEENNKMKYDFNKFGVSDVITHNNKVVIVKFSDGTFTKSICSDNDNFDIDVGISICILKRLLCKDGKVEEANRNYNSLIRRVHKLMDKKESDRLNAIKLKKERRENQVSREKKNEVKRAKLRNEFIEDIAHGVKLAASLDKEDSNE